MLYMGYSALLLEDAYLKIDNNAAGLGIYLMDGLIEQWQREGHNTLNWISFAHRESFRLG
jgi:hypothetical protein